MDSAQAQKEATHVTLFGMWVDIFLGIGKILGGFFTNSFALIADGIHSLTDAATDIFVILITRLARIQPNAERPIEHGRFETLGTIAMGMVIFAAAGILLYDAINRLFATADLPIPAAWGIGLALISIAAKEWIFHYTMKVAKRLNSSLLKANAWHSRSDAISSIAVLIGLIGALQGYAWMDTLAAMFISLIIAKIGWGLCADSLKELVDTAISNERQQRIEKCVRGIAGIGAISSLRSRLSGGKIILEVRLLVDPGITVSAGHEIGEAVSLALRGNFSDIGDVIVHIDPLMVKESRGSNLPVADLPERAQVLKLIRQSWQELLNDDDIENMDLHYFEHGIEVELTVSQEELPARLARQLEQAIRRLGYITGVRIYHKLYESADPLMKS